MKPYILISALILSSCAQNCEMSSRTVEYSDNSSIKVVLLNGAVKFVSDSLKIVEMTGIQSNLERLYISDSTDDYGLYLTTNGGANCDERTYCTIHAPNFRSIELGTPMFVNGYKELDYQYADFGSETINTDSFKLVNWDNFNFSLKVNTHHLDLNGYFDADNLIEGQSGTLSLDCSNGFAKNFNGTNLIVDTAGIRIYPDAISNGYGTPRQILNLHVNSLISVTAINIWPHTQDSSVIINYTGHPTIINPHPDKIVFNDVN